MTTFLLIRHALCDPIGKAIAGRAPGVHLNASGQAQATALARRLESLPICAIYSSPLERAIQTAAPIAGCLGLPVSQAAGLLEVDFGDWTGRTLAELDLITGWRDFNTNRSGTRIPGGETMGEVLTRALNELIRIQQCYSGAGQVVALVSHGDVLRVLVAHLLGLPIDMMQRLEIDPASVTVLSLQDREPRLLLLNSTGGWPAELTSSSS